MKPIEIFCFGIVVLLLTMPGLGVTSALSAPSPTTAASSAGIALPPSGQEDPNKGPSELNHHLAGFALITVGGLMLAALLFTRLRWLQMVWPLMFLLLGLFLAAWSDAEIWPRGNVGWGWLLHYDAEARMHKLYAILLLAIGVVEYLRLRNNLSTLWRTWGFPAIALLGAVLLLFHDHSGGAGLPPESGVNDATMMAGFVSVEQAPHQSAEMAEMHHEGSEHMGNSNTDAGAQSNLTQKSSDMESPDNHSSHHHMSASMVKVEHEHFWFAVVGVAIAFFKWLSDVSRGRRAAFAAYLWPGLMIVLGVLLVGYTE